MPRGSSKARWEQHAQGEWHKKALYIVAPFHEIEDKLVSGWIRGAGDYFCQHVEFFLKLSSI
jgi:hypothetical protein